MAEIFWRKLSRFVSAAGIAVFAAMPGAALDDDPAIDWEGSLSLVSDFRDRGVSITDEDFALVGSLGAYHKSGFYAGLLALNVDDRNDRDFKGDFYVGYQKESGAYLWDFAVEIDSMIGGIDDKVFPEFQASVARDYGLAYVRLGTGYAPEGRWISPDGRDAVYSYLDAEFPIPNMPAFTILTHFGYDIRSQRSDLYDWSVGVSAFVNDYEFTISYDDSTSNDPLASGAIVFGFRRYF